MVQRKRPKLPPLQSNPPAKQCWGRHSVKWNGPYPSTHPIRVKGMSREDTDAEQDTCYRDELDHALLPETITNRAPVSFRLTSSDQENGFVAELETAPALFEAGAVPNFRGAGG